MESHVGAEEHLKAMSVGAERSLVVAPAGAVGNTTSAGNFQRKERRARLDDARRTNGFVVPKGWFGNLLSVGSHWSEAEFAWATIVAGNKQTDEEFW